MGEKIEIRGLGDIVRDARKSIADAREHSAGLRDDTRDLVSTVKDVRTQVRALHDDLKFEMSTLGNNPPGESSGDTEEKSGGEKSGETFRPADVKTDGAAGA